MHMMMPRDATSTLIPPHDLKHRERSWKLKQCKRFATAITRSNLGIEARAANREKQEAEAMRRKAAWVAKQVCGHGCCLGEALVWSHTCRGGVGSD